MNTYFMIESLNKMFRFRIEDYIVHQPKKGKRLTPEDFVGLPSCHPSAKNKNSFYPVILLVLPLKHSNDPF